MLSGDFRISLIFKILQRLKTKETSLMGVFAVLFIIGIIRVLVVGKKSDVQRKLDDLSQRSSNFFWTSDFFRPLLEISNFE